MAEVRRKVRRRHRSKRKMGVKLGYAVLIAAVWIIAAAMIVLSVQGGSADL